MKKECLLSLIVCAMLFVPSVCRADNETKEAIRKQMMDECVQSAIDEEVPPSFAVKACNCSVDKVLKKYSVEELIEIDNYRGKVNEFMKDMEDFVKECALEALSE